MEETFYITIVVILGLLFFLLPIIALIVSNNAKQEMRRRMTAIEEEMEGLRATIAKLRHSPADAGTVMAESILHKDIAVAPPASPPAPAPEIPASQPEIPVAAPEARRPRVPLSRTAGRSAMASAQPEKPETDNPVADNREPKPARAPKHARSKEEWEDLVGGRLLNRIGAVALIIGVGFFLKYAFDREWITETMRAILGGAFGFALLLVGYRSFRKGYQVFSQGLVGAGVAVLYLSVYAAFNFYDLGISQTAAFIMMMAVTVIAFQQAFQYNSVAVSLLGLIGGFLTPIMLSTGQANELGLFTYIAILDAGILAIVAVKRSWGVLEPLALFGTWGLYTGWAFEYFQPEHKTVAMIFASIFWALFHGLDLYRSFSSREPLPPASHAVALLNPAFYYMALYALFGAGDQWTLAICSIVLGAIYFAPSLLRRNEQETGIQAGRNAVIAMLLFALAVGVAPGSAANEYLKVIAWGAEVLGFFWLGARLKFSPLWMMALLLLAFDLLMLSVFSFDAYDGALPGIAVTRAELMELWLAVVAALLVIPARSIDKAGWRESIIAGAQYLCALLGLLLLTSIADRTTLALVPARSIAVPGRSPELVLMERVEFIGAMIRAFVWLGYALLLLGIGGRKNWRPVLHAGLAMTLIAVGQACFEGITYRPIQSYVPVLNLRAGALIAAVLAMIAAARMLMRHGVKLPLIPRAADILRIAAVLVIFELLTVETYDYFNAATQAIADAAPTLGPGDLARIEYLGNMEQLAISGVWLLYSVILMATGFLRRLRSLRIISFAIFGLAIIKIFVYDLSFLDTLYRIFSFMGLGVILLSISFLYTRYKDQIFGDPEGSAASGPLPDTAAGEALGTEQKNMEPQDTSGRSDDEQ